MNNGIIEVFATGGIAPYQYSMNNSNFQYNNVFTGLTGGLYSILVTDSKSCTDTVSLQVGNLRSNLSANVSVLPDSDCIGDNGSFTIHVAGGVSPFTFRVGSGTPMRDSIFTNLNFGQYTIVIGDATNCTYSLEVTVPRVATSISWQRDIAPIINLSCAKSGCHIEGSGRSNFTKFEEVKRMAFQIKSRVVSKSMPYDAVLPEEQIQLITCWVDDGALEN